MQWDYENMFSNDQVVCDGGSEVSENVVDLAVAGRAPDEPLYIGCQVTQTFLTITSVEAQVQTATDAAFTSPVTLQKALLAVADLVAGAQFPLGILTGSILQFLRLNYVQAGSNATAGKITAGLLLGIEK